MGRFTLLAALWAAALCAAAQPAAAQAPTNTSNPQLAGVARVDQTVTLSDGTWTGAPEEFERTWIRCVPVQSGGCMPELFDVTGPTYTLGDADLGARVYVRMRARNASGWSDYVFTNDVGPVAPRATTTTPPPDDGETTTPSPEGGRPCSRGGRTGICQDGPPPSDCDPEYDDCEEGGGTEEEGGDRGAPDPLARSLTALKLAPATFRARKRGPSIARAPRGTTIKYTVNAEVTVVFTVQRALTGRKSGGKCVKARKRNRKARKCTRWKAVKGEWENRTEAGTHSLKFTGVVGGKALRPGRYRLSAAPLPVEGKGQARMKKFRIVR